MYIFIQIFIYIWLYLLRYEMFKNKCIIFEHFTMIFIVKNFGFLVLRYNQEKLFSYILNILSSFSCFPRLFSQSKSDLLSGCHCDICSEFTVPFNALPLKLLTAHLSWIHFFPVFIPILLSLFSTSRLESLLSLPWSILSSLHNPFHP
jgi:hypothetical protein